MAERGFEIGDRVQDRSDKTWGTIASAVALHLGDELVAVAWDAGENAGGYTTIRATKFLRPAKPSPSPTAIVAAEEIIRDAWSITTSSKVVDMLIHDAIQKYATIIDRHIGPVERVVEAASLIGNSLPSNYNGDKGVVISSRLVRGLLEALSETKEVRGG